MNMKKPKLKDFQLPTGPGVRKVEYDYKAYSKELELYTLCLENELGLELLKNSNKLGGDNYVKAHEEEGDHKKMYPGQKLFREYRD